MFKSKKILTLVLVIDSNKILLGMKKRGFGANKFNGFGGKVEQGETIEEGAKRELMEECEIEAIDLEKRGLLLFTFEDDPIALETHIFVTKQYQGHPNETEEMKPEWFTLDTIPFDKMWSDDKYWFPSLLAGELFTGHFHFAKDQETIIKNEVAIVKQLSTGFDLDDAWNNLS
ncbi:NUDIX hydrolase domain-like protein [Blakeslea trispora]|nr:NUDIX hydrolase domain-like protein [Blakeslea trispora]